LPATSSPCLYGRHPRRRLRHVRSGRAARPGKGPGGHQRPGAERGGLPPGRRRGLYETDKFPGVVAAPFGWFIVFKTDKPTVVWREEFELPTAPPTWGPGEAMGIFQVTPDRRTAVTERIIPTKLGFIANEWRYAPGDPIGAHKMRVYIDGQLIREFGFDIEKAPEGLGTRRNPHRGDDSASGSTT
jgi:hypothetical protein